MGSIWYGSVRSGAGSVRRKPEFQSLNRLPLGVAFKSRWVSGAVGDSAPGGGANGGGGCFTGSHLVKCLKHDGSWVRAIDFSKPPFLSSAADELLEGDLRDPGLVELTLRINGRTGFDLVFQLAADMPAVKCDRKAKLLTTAAQRGRDARSTD